MTQPLPGPLQPVASLLETYGYGVVGAFVFVEGFGIPAPAVTTLVAASVYAGAGYLHLPTLAVIAVLATILGDNVGYAIGRAAGMPALRRWGRYVRLGPDRLERVEHFLATRGAAAILLARFVDGFRQTNGLICGALGVPWRRRYLPLDAAGGVLWAGVWTGVGYLAGDHIDVVFEQVRRFQTVGLALAAVVLLALVARRAVRRGRGSRATES